MPDRTTIVLPADLKERAVAQARLNGVSFAEFLRTAVEKELASNKTPSGAKTGDPFLDNLTIYDDGGPTDWSTRVDELVYGVVEDEFRGHRRISRAPSRKRSFSRRSHKTVAKARPASRDK